VRLLVVMNIKQTPTVTTIVAPHEIVGLLKCIQPFCMVLKAMWWFDRWFDRATFLVYPYSIFEWCHLFPMHIQHPTLHAIQSW
jgi:hypothetical protein